MKSKYIVLEALPSAELVFLCDTKREIQEAIEELVNEFGCDVKDILVLPTEHAIPFTFKKVQSVEISL